MNGIFSQIASNKKKIYIIASIVLMFGFVLGNIFSGDSYEDVLEEMISNGKKDNPVERIFDIDNKDRKIKINGLDFKIENANQYRIRLEKHYMMDEDCDIEYFRRIYKKAYEDYSQFAKTALEIANNHFEKLISVDIDRDDAVEELRYQNGIIKICAGLTEENNEYYENWVRSEFALVVFGTEKYSHKRSIYLVLWFETYRSGVSYK